MNYVHMNLLHAVRVGDLKTVKQSFSVMSDTERDVTLCAHAQGTSAFVKRPSGESQIRVCEPTLLMLAVTEWYPGILEYLASLKTGLDEEHIVDDPINSPRRVTGVTSLHIAALSGKLQMVQMLLQQGATLDKTTSLGDTALYEASFEGHQAIAQELISKGADVTHQNLKQISCLMIAAYADHPHILRLLVENKGDLNARDEEGRNVLFYSVAAGKIDTLAYLLDSGAEVVTDLHGVNILMEAAHHGNKEMIVYLISYDTMLNLDLNELDSVGRNVLFYVLEQENIDNLELFLNVGVQIQPMNDGRTLLMAAALNCNNTLVDYLLSNASLLGIDPNEKDHKGRNVLFYCITGGDLALFEHVCSQGVAVESSTDGVTLLMQAVAKNRPEFVAFLLENANKCGLDVNTEDIDGWNAVFYAVASGFLHIFIILTKAGVDCRHSNDNRTVLMQAVAKGNFELVRHILDNAKDFSVYINQRDNDGWNALFYAIQGGHMDEFTFLLKRGAKVCVALNGATLLMEAVDKNQIDFVQYLIDNQEKLSIDINHRDNEGNNALVYAVANGNYTIFQTLLNAGCKVGSDKQERTLLMQAALHGHIELVQHLVNFSDSLGIDIHHCDKDGRNALFYCIENGHQDVLEFLVLSGLRPQPDTSARTNLMQASRSGFLDIVKYLVTNASTLDISVNSIDANGENALFYASRCDNSALYYYLLQQGIDVICNKHGISILAQSIHDRKLELTQCIIKHGKNLTDAVRGKDVTGRTALHHFVMMGDLDTLTLLSQHYSSDYDCDNHKCTLLMYSCARTGAHQLNITKYLIETLHVDVNVVDAKNRNALMHAVLANNSETVVYLLEYTNVQFKPDAEEVCVLMIACSLGSSIIAEKLLQAKQSKDLCSNNDSKGRNAFHHCAMQGNLACLTLLKTYDCDINGRDFQGLTPLMLAVQGGHAQLVTSLLMRAADVHVYDNDNKSALHHCFSKTPPSVKCVKELLRYGVDVNQQDTNRVTALMLACQSCAKSDINVIKVLLDAGADPTLLDGEGQDAYDYCAYDAEYVKALMRNATEMHPWQRETLDLYARDLASLLDVTSVLRGLVQQQIFTRTLSFQVMKCTASDRVPRLLELLHHRGVGAFNAFCKVLKQEGEVELAYKLMKDSYRKDVEIYW